MALLYQRYHLVINGFISLWLYNWGFLILNHCLSSHITKDSDIMLCMIKNIVTIRNEPFLHMHSPHICFLHILFFFLYLIAGGRFHKSYICRLTFKKRLFTEDTKYVLLGYIQLPTWYINLKILEAGIKKSDDDPSEAKTC